MITPRNFFKFNVKHVDKFIGYLKNFLKACVRTEIEFECPGDTESGLDL